MTSKIRQDYKFDPLPSFSKIILDCDTGCDDAQAIVAIIHLAKKFGKQILGITCVDGNGYINDVVINTLITLKACDSKLPIYRGANKSIIGQGIKDFYFGKDAFNNQQQKYKQHLTEEDYKQIQSETAFQFISDSAQKYSKQLAIVATGPLTNIAIAYLNNNRIPQLISSITIMGGSHSGIGLNEAFSSEFNFNSDADAAHIVIKYFPNIVLIPLEVGFEYGSPNRDCFAYDKSKRGQLIKDVFDGVAHVLCDPLTLFPVFMPETVKKCWKVYAEVVRFGQRTTGMLACDWIPKKNNKKPNVTFVVEMDHELIDKEMMESVLQ